MRRHRRRNFPARLRHKVLQRFGALELKRRLGVLIGDGRADLLLLRGAEMERRQIGFEMGLRLVRTAWLDGAAGLVRGVRTADAAIAAVGAGIFGAALRRLGSGGRRQSHG